MYPQRFRLRRIHASTCTKPCFLQAGGRRAAGREAQPYPALLHQERGVDEARLQLAEAQPGLKWRALYKERSEVGLGPLDLDWELLQEVRQAARDTASPSGPAEATGHNHLIT